MSPRAIPCRMCQAGPGESCTYKRRPISGVLGGHDRRTPRSQRCYHYKRVEDAQIVRREMRR